MIDYIIYFMYKQETRDIPCHIIISYTAGSGIRKFDIVVQHHLI